MFPIVRKTSSTRFLHTILHPLLVKIVKCQITFFHYISPQGFRISKKKILHPTLGSGGKRRLTGTSEGRCFENNNYI